MVSMEKSTTILSEGFRCRPTFLSKNCKLYSCVRNCQDFSYFSSNLFSPMFSCVRPGVLKQPLSVCSILILTVPKLCLCTHALLVKSPIRIDHNNFEMAVNAQTRFPTCPGCKNLNGATSTQSPASPTLSRRRRWVPRRSACRGRPDDDGQVLGGGYHGDGAVGDLSETLQHGCLGIALQGD